jgi:hypothetical protein
MILINPFRSGGMGWIMYKKSGMEYGPKWTRMDQYFDYCELSTVKYTKAQAIVICQNDALQSDTRFRGGTHTEGLLRVKKVNIHVLFHLSISIS